MRRLLTVIVSCLLSSQAFALDRVVVRDSRGRVVVGIVSNGWKSVYVDRKGHVTAMSVRRGNTLVVKMLRK